VNVVSCDSGYDVSVEGVVREIMEKHGRIDILVNNTGAGRTGKSSQSGSPATRCTEVRAGALMDQPLDAVKRDFSVGVFDVLRMTQAVVPHMAKRKHGLVVNIGSMGGHMYVVLVHMLGSTLTERFSVLLPGAGYQAQPNLPFTL
jgi:NAD(P)-dependent dehydrogenase (short-subunit alcohol dehydrogenase family)